MASTSTRWPRAFEELGIQRLSRSTDREISCLFYTVAYVPAIVLFVSALGYQQNGHMGCPNGSEQKSRVVPEVRYEEVCRRRAVKKCAGGAW